MPTVSYVENRRPENNFNNNFPEDLIPHHDQPGWSYNDEWHEEWMYNRWSKVLCKCLRHDWELQVDNQGFAYCEDVG